MATHTHELPTIVLDTSFESFLATHVSGRTLLIGYDGRPAPSIDGHVNASVETTTVLQDEHDSRDEYLPDEFQAAFDTVVVDLPPTGYFSRAGAVLAAEETLTTGGELIVRVSGKAVPGWVKFDMNNTTLTKLIADRPNEPFSDAPPVAIYEKQQSHLGAWE
jgi:hypothetical protein